MIKIAKKVIFFVIPFLLTVLYVVFEFQVLSLSHIPAVRFLPLAALAYLGFGIFYLKKGSEIGATYKTLAIIGYTIGATTFVLVGILLTMLGNLSI